MKQPSTRPASTTLDRAVRKGTIRSRPHTRYTTDMDELELARSMPTPRSVGAMRDGSRDVRSVANVQTLSLLQEIFPSVAVELLEDVLVAAQFRMDTAASMLGELSRELSGEDAPERSDLVMVDWTTVQSDLDMGDDDQWHEVAASRPEMQQWVLVQDDWEVVEDDTKPREKTRTYADVLCSSSSKEPTAVLPKLSPTAVAASLSPLARQKKADAAPTLDDPDDVSCKSFGARKRRSLRKFRS